MIYTIYLVGSLFKDYRYHILGYHIPDITDIYIAYSLYTSSVAGNHG